MEIDIRNKDGWFFQDQDKSIVHEITTIGINELLALAQEEDCWVDYIRYLVHEREKAISDGSWWSRPESSFLKEECLFLNTEGTVHSFPYGKRIITFPIRRHLFRGENQMFPASVPSLNRTLSQFEDETERELYRAVSYLRKNEFGNLIWQIDVVPYWEAKISDVNYDALAQHYGFETHLLDLTNDIRIALFFATCKYDPVTHTYAPLNHQDITKNENTQYGYIYHAPDWIIDYMNGGGALRWGEQHLPRTKEEIKDIQFYLQSGDMDGVAMQIGYQPLYRCHCQSGYIFPMRNETPLQTSPYFEVIKFKQSETLSNAIYTLMKNGKTIFPDEGITEISDLLLQLQNTTTFSTSALEEVYHFDGIDKSIFPSFDSLKNSINGFKTFNGPITIKDSVNAPSIPAEKLKRINNYYNNRDLLVPIGGKIYQRPEDRIYRESCCKMIYG